MNRKPKNNNNNKNKQVRRRNVVKTVVIKKNNNNKNKNQQRNKPRVNIVNQMRQFEVAFNSATKDLINLVCNPLHSVQPAKFTDNFKGATLPMYDYRAALGGFGIEMTLDDTLYNPPNQFLFYMTYGPATYSLVSPGSVAAWYLWCLPLDSVTQKPFPDNSGYFPVMMGTNHDNIWNLVDEVRMISMGFRVNPLNDVNTATDGQIITQFIAGQLKFSDFLKLVDTGSTNSIQELLQRPKQEYQNMEGASARYCPFQGPFQTEFWTYDVLLGIDTDNIGYFNIEDLNFPYVLINMKQTVTGVATSTTSDLPHERIQDEDNDIIDDNENEFVTALSVKHQGADKIKAKYKPKPPVHATSIPKDKVGTVSSVYFYIPIKFEGKWWLETKLSLPTPIISLPSPLDMHWANLPYWFAANNIPDISDGHSFSNVLKKLNPKNVRKGSKYVGGMIRSTKQGMADITKAFL